MTKIDIQQTLSGNSSADCLRSLHWKSLENERNCYEELQGKFAIQPSQEDIDPLSQADDSPWNEFFKDEELKKVIKGDVGRTFPDMEMFRQINVQSVLENVLFIWSKMHPDVSYRQGMHELVAVVYYVVQKDSVDPSSPDLEDQSKVLFNNQFIEHDTAALFIRIMNSVKPWYEKPQSSVKNNSPILLLCKKIHSVYLKTLDKELYEHLETLQIEPQIYGLRWIRLLFSREFEFNKVLGLWDGIFKLNHDLNLVEWIALSLILEPQLITSSYNSAMTLLMRYPNNQSILSGDYISIAIRLKSSYSKLQQDLMDSSQSASRSQNSPNDLKNRLIKIVETLESIDTISEIYEIKQKVQTAKQELKFVTEQTNFDLFSRPAERTENSFLDGSKTQQITQAADRVAGQVKAGFYNLVGLLDRAVPPKMNKLPNSHSASQLKGGSLPNSIDLGKKSLNSAIETIEFQNKTFVSSPSSQNQQG